MSLRLTTLSKVFIIIFILFIPVVCMYAYSNWKSIETVTEQVQTSNLNRLEFFRSQMDETITQIAKNVFTLMNDPDIEQLKHWDPADEFLYEKVAVLKRIKLKLLQQSTATGWITDISVITPITGELKSNNESTVDLDRTDDQPGIHWQVQRSERTGRKVFSTVLVDPFDRLRQGDNALKFHISFHEQDVIRMLDFFKNEGRSDPFLYHANEQFVLNSSAENREIRAIAEAFKANMPLHDAGYIVADVNGEDFFISFVRLHTIDWFLIDYEPLGHILKPLAFSRNIFYVTAVLLVFSNIFLAFVLYKKVIVPIKKLVVGVDRIKRGDYSSRIAGSHSNEFDFLNHRFNEMAAEIQHLIEHVYQEKLRAQEATLKQLQSQINPHFLYNSLHFINIMNYRGDRDAVAAMVTNLGNYYRYTTHLEHPMSALGEELQFVANYLEIHRLRSPRLSYSIDVPEAMLEARVPRLILQPIVENSIIHGFDRQNGPCLIRISGSAERDKLLLIVEDNGIGLSDDALDRLRHTLQRRQENQGFGVWNVHQRLVHHFGSGCGLDIARSASGGLRTCLRFVHIKQEGATRHDAHSDRR